MKKLLVFLLVASCMAGCSPSTQITSSWRKPGNTRTYQHVMIAGLTHSLEAKSTVENDLANALSARGIMVYKSLDYFLPNFTKDIQKEEMLKKIREIGADAIITVSIIDKETQPTYVPGGPMAYPAIGYGGFWGYYNYWYPTMYSPGYYRQDRIYYIETNVYDTSTDELVWSVQSKTYNPPDLSGFSKELANLVVNKLQKDGLIGIGNKKMLHKKSVAADIQNN